MQAVMSVGMHDHCDENRASRARRGCMQKIRYLTDSLTLQNSDCNADSDNNPYGIQWVLTDKISVLK